MDSKTSRQACRQFHYKSEEDTITVKVLELLDSDFGLYVWPSALVLAEYLFYRLDMFYSTPGRSKTILELGAGTALPSLLLAKALPCTQNFLIVTDRPDVPQILDNVREALRENNVYKLYPRDPDAQVMVRGLGWGDFALASGENNDGGLLQLLEDVTNMKQSSSNTSRQIDLILGSDVFYNPQDFESLLATVAYIINRHNPECVFLTSYQNRSAKRNIDHLLTKWGLEGRIIEWEDFGFDMSKFVVGGTGDSDKESDQDDKDDQDEPKSCIEEEVKRANDTPVESEDDRWLRMAREEVERAMKYTLNLGKQPSGHKSSIVDYSSGSNSEDEMDVMDAINEGRGREIGKDEEHGKDRGGSTYRMGDGGALSSVHLLWICKQGRGSRFEDWRTSHD
ncbi:hypothetical protein EDD21DRAFT_391027 [Dissophora ornata]|nr:Methyltransferase-like protein 23 [Dissophora ornata]KAI8595523.1 hypothetical protein EDD21DRAFT_391027 [Dissophora ornata]